MADQRIDDLFAELSESKGPNTDPRRMKRYFEYLFADVNLSNKNVLDVGGGVGGFSMFAALKGATRVVCLEPGAAGATSNLRSKSKALQERFGLENVRYLPVRLQDYAPGSEKADVILMHNSVNHLDEDACIRLHQDESARSAYVRMFSQVADIASHGATLIVADCSSRNVFGVLGLRNPIVPSIEWHKHQAPEVWSSLLSEAGFTVLSVRWPASQRFGALGTRLLSNRVASFFLSSYFVMTFVKSEIG